MSEKHVENQNDRLDRIAAIICAALYRIVTQDITGPDTSAPYSTPSSHFRLDFPTARSEGCEPSERRLTGEKATENGRIRT